jgi:hypothetical protein
MSAVVAELLAILDLARMGDDRFLGHSPKAYRKRVFGGQLIAQALVAAARTVEGAEPHSLHGYFLLPGDPSTPIEYHVERLRDGRSFATRRCTAIQHGRLIFTLTCSFHAAEEGLDHALPMPEARFPEPKDRIAFYRKVEARLAALPGVESVALTTGIPIYGYGTDRQIFTEKQTSADKSNLPQASLASLGAPFDPARAGDAVRAELLVNARGDVLAVRFPG